MEDVPSESRLQVKRIGRWFLYCIIVGLLAGCASSFFHLILNVGHIFFLNWLAGYNFHHPAGEEALIKMVHHPLRPWLLWCLPGLGGLITGIIVWKFCPDAEGHGTDAAIRAYHFEDGYIPFKVPIVKTIASFFTLGTGGSGGSEGPICHIGAGVGSVFAQKMNLTPREMRILMAAGLGAGIGSIFKAPLTGALFAAEVLYQDPEFEAEVIIPTTIAAIVAYSVFCTFFGWDSLFHAGDYRIHSALELIPYTGLAIAASIAVFIFVKMFWGIHDLFHKFPIPPWVKPAIGGLITGTIGLFMPEVLGFSYGFLQQGFYQKVAGTKLFSVSLGKIAATSFSIGSGGSGGVFGPSVVIGGCLGGAVGALFHHLFPEIVHSAGPYAVVGIAGFLAGNSNIPITAIIAVSELTGSYHLLLPSMLVCSLCYFLCRNWNLYREQLPNTLASPAHKGDFFTDILQDIRVKDIFNPHKVTAVLPEDMTLAQFRKFFRQTEQRYFPVVDKQGRLTGIFSINDVRNCLFDHELDDIVTMKDIAREQIITTTPNEDINTLLRKFTLRNIDQIPVVKEDEPTVFMGMISRREVIAFYNQTLNNLKENIAQKNKQAVGF